MATELELSGKCQHMFKRIASMRNNKYLQTVYECCFCKKKQTKFQLVE